MPAWQAMRHLGAGLLNAVWGKGPSGLICRKNAHGPHAFLALQGNMPVCRRQPFDGFLAGIGQLRQAARAVALALTRP